MAAGPAIWRRVVEIEMENLGTTDLADHFGTSGAEDELVLSISEPRSPEAYAVNGNGSVFGPLAPLAPIREEVEDGTSDGTEVIGTTETVDHIITIIPEPHICRNGCGTDEDCNGHTIDSLDVLVELGCHCRGSMSRICVKCMLKWFGPRIIIQKDKTCEVCQTLLHERVEKRVWKAFADHTGGSDILVGALGAPLARAHEARHAHNANNQRLQMLSLQRDNDVVVNGNGLPHGPEDAADASDVAPDVAPDAAAGGAPGALAQQQVHRSFWTRIQRYMCCSRVS